MSTRRLLPRFLTIFPEPEVAGAQRYIISKNPQMLSDQSFVAARLAGAAGEGDAAGVQDHYFVGELEGEPDVLLDEQDRLAFGLQAGDGAADLGDDERREALGGLVHQEHARVAHQRPRDGEHLLLAAGKGARDLLGARLELREQLEDAGQVPGRGGAPSFRHPQVLPHRQRGEDAPALRHEADAFARDRLRREPGDRLAEQADRAFARRQEADDRAHAGGLAGAVPAEQRENSPRSYRKRDAMQHVAVAVERVDPLQRESLSGQDTPRGSSGRPPPRPGSPPRSPGRNAAP